MDPLDQAVRDAAERLVRETELSFTVIGTRTGITASTIASWSQRHGWRRPVRAARRLKPSTWASARLHAVARLYATPEVDPGDLAEALGTARPLAERLFADCGFAARAAPDPEPGLDGASLRAALRGHIARQIAGLDAALRLRAGPIDSAKVLRDLGGLKRLLDETETGDGAEHPDAEREPRTDLPALRAEIARRYAAFAGERPDAGLPGEPAAAADPDARHGLAPLRPGRPASALRDCAVMDGSLMDDLGGDRGARLGQDPDGGGMGAGAGDR